MDALNSLTSMCQKIDSAINKAMKPALKLPNILAICSTFTRSGGSAQEVVARIFADLTRIDPRLGSDVTSDGKPSKLKMVINSIVKNEHDVRRTQEVIQSVLPPGSLNLSVIGNKATNLTATGLFGFPHC